MSSDRWAIQLSGLSKTYSIPETNDSGIFKRRGGKGSASGGASKGFSAVRDLSLDIPKGKTVGIVGRNGSGKSTLLQMVCGTIQPSAGEVKVFGKIAALLELGAGFNSEFTGRQNVMLNAAIHGMSRGETLRKLDAIIEFADIGSFIDRPVKTYSSGMYVRLAFASAINSEADILIVDEALAVGDEAFQRKCFARIKHLQSLGTTVLFVSHSVQSVVELCDHAVLMDAGEKLLEGDPKAVTAYYQRLVHAPAAKVAEIRKSIQELAVVSASDSPSRSQPNQAVVKDKPKPGASADLPLSFEAFDPGLEPSSRLEYAEKGARLSNVQITNESGQPCNILDHGKRYHFSYTVEFSQKRDLVVFAMMVKTVRGLEVFGQWSAEIGEGVSLDVGDKVDVSFPFDNSLLPGTYFCNAGIFSGEDGEFEILHRVVDVGMFKVAPYEYPNHMRGLVSAVYPAFRTKSGCAGDLLVTCAQVTVRRSETSGSELAEQQR